MRDGIYWFSGGKQDCSCLAIQMQNEYFLAIKRNNIVPLLSTLIRFRTQWCWLFIWFIIMVLQFILRVFWCFCSKMYKKYKYYRPHVYKVGICRLAACFFYPIDFILSPVFFICQHVIWYTILIVVFESGRGICQY